MQFDGTSATPRHSVALCLSVLSVEAHLHWFELIKMCTFRAATSDVHISVTNWPNIMILYMLELFLTAKMILRPGIFIIQK